MRSLITVLWSWFTIDPIVYICMSLFDNSLIVSYHNQYDSHIIIRHYRLFIGMVLVLILLYVHSSGYIFCILYP